MRLKAKYTSGANCKGTPYRTRTGPKCCNKGCGRRRSKAVAMRLGKGK